MPNNRLPTLYSQIENSNKKAFLDNKLEVDQMWGKNIFGVTLQVDLSEKIRDQLTKYQEELQVLDPQAFLFLPRSYQHISFNQVVFWGGEYQDGTERTWQKVETEFISKFKALDKTFSGFDITFSKLVATTGGIIWCASDLNDEFEHLRQELLDTLPFPAETTKLNHIIHTTVARFKRQLHNPLQVLEWATAQNQAISMKVSEIILRKELIFPSIKTEEIARIDLK